MPFPVIAGFLASVGCTIVRSGLVVAIGSPSWAVADITDAIHAAPVEFSISIGFVVLLEALRRIKLPSALGRMARDHGYAHAPAEAKRPQRPSPV